MAYSATENMQTNIYSLFSNKWQLEYSSTEDKKSGTVEVKYLLHSMNESGVCNIWCFEDVEYLYCVDYDNRNSLT